MTMMDKERSRSGAGQRPAALMTGVIAVAIASFAAYQLGVSNRAWTTAGKEAARTWVDGYCQGSFTGTEYTASLFIHFRYPDQLFDPTNSGDVDYALSPYSLSSYDLTTTWHRSVAEGLPVFFYNWDLSSIPGIHPVPSHDSLNAMSVDRAAATWCQSIGLRVGTPDSNYLREGARG